MVASVEERITAGEIVPAGECPDCGALAHLDEPEVAPPVYVVGVEGGVVQGMSTSRIDSRAPRIIICDWDARDDEGIEVGDSRANVYEPNPVLDAGFVSRVVAAIDAADFENAPAGFARSIMDAAMIHDLAVKGDGIEISPVKEDATSVEVCSPADATAWSVYIHRDGDGVECIADWDHPGQAERHARELLSAYSNLAEHGIIRGGV
jgi:hypothetical protein